MSGGLCLETLDILKSLFFWMFFLCIFMDSYHDSHVHEIFMRMNFFFFISSKSHFSCEPINSLKHH